MAKHYANRKKTRTADYFEGFSEDTWSGISHKHYKQIILERIVHDSDPNDRHIREWTNTQGYPQKFVKALLKEMEREGLIKIQYINDRGCIKRTLTRC